MKLLFKQRMFSWFDSFDVYDEEGRTAYVVKGALSWGHMLKIYDANGNEIGKVREKVLTFLPKFEMYLGERYIGAIKKEFTLLRPRFTVDCKDWHIEGDWFEWNYRIVDSSGMCVAYVNKQLFNWTDTYVIDVCHSGDALAALMLVLAIDAEKCSRRD